MERCLSERYPSVVKRLWPEFSLSLIGPSGAEQAAGARLWKAPWQLGLQTLKTTPMTNRGVYTEALALLAGMIYPALLTWIYFLVLAESPASRQQLAYTIGKVVQFVFPILWVKAVRKESLSSLFARSTKGIFEGILFGVMVTPAMVLGYSYWLGPLGIFQSAGSAIQEKLAGMNLDTPGRYLVLAAFYAAVHSLLEEYYWRWFVFGRLRTLFPVGWAISVSSVAFTLHHILVLGYYFGWTSWPCWLFSLAVAGGGAYWAWLYQRSGNLWGTWIGHLAVDAGIFAVGYQMLGW